MPISSNGDAGLVDSPDSRSPFAGTGGRGVPGFFAGAARPLARFVLWHSSNRGRSPLQEATTWLFH